MSRGSRATAPGARQSVAAAGTAARVHLLDATNSQRDASPSQRLVAP